MDENPSWGGGVARLAEAEGVEHRQHQVCASRGGEAGSARSPAWAVKPVPVSHAVAGRKFLAALALLPKCFIDVVRDPLEPFWNGEPKRIVDHVLWPADTARCMAAAFSR
jgi:hypothetical protein